ncbi:MAG: DUF3800 domain-containing protein [Janthinobacterium lividum]
MGTTIYLDESGCLGWKFDQPYKQGGSSRFFTLAAAVVPNDADPVLSRVMRGLYKKRKRRTSSELKSVSLKSGERVRFANSLHAICQSRADVLFTAITVRKENVNQAFRRSPNGLYNFMTKLLLLDVMAEYDSVAFIPDVRSIKVEFKHDLHQYLESGKRRYFSNFYEIQEVSGCVERLLVFSHTV